MRKSISSRQVNMISHGKGNGWLFLSVLAAAALLTACGSNLKVINLDPTTGRFPTDTKLSPENFIARTNLDVEAFKQLCYIRSETSSSAQFRDFLKGLFIKLGFFDAVKDKKGMESYIISKGLPSSALNISDFAGLNALQKQIGDFLVADYSVEAIAPYTWRFDIILTNPASGATVLHITHHATNWAGIDKPLFYPVFNGIKDWIEENRAKK